MADNEGMKALLFVLVVLSCRCALSAERYKVVVGAVRSDTFLLDTDTGKIWHMLCNADNIAKDGCGEVYWREMRKTGPPKDSGFDPDAYLKSKAATPPRDQP